MHTAQSGKYKTMNDTDYLKKLYNSYEGWVEIQITREQMDLLLAYSEMKKRKPKTFFDFKESIPELQLI